MIKLGLENLFAVNTVPLQTGLSLHDAPKQNLGLFYLPDFFFIPFRLSLGFGGWDLVTGLLLRLKFVDKSQICDQFVAGHSVTC